MPTSSHYRADPRHLDLGEELFDVVQAAEFPVQMLRFRNQRWAERVGLGSLSDDEWKRHFASFEALPDNLTEPLALRYHGHQFDVYNPALGDGRGFLFAQLRDDAGRLLDCGTKGSGTTPYSRGGDGRLTLKGGVREVLATEMLEALGVPTSKSFSLFETGERLHRGDEPSPTRSSVLTRLSHSHVRIGTFQCLAHSRQPDVMRSLVEFCLEHYYPELGSPPDAPGVLLRGVIERTAITCAGWMAAGFVHGVLNSDNMNVTGESFDYGPYRFLPTYDPEFTAAYFDQTGLYAFGRQPKAVLTNLVRLERALSILGEHSARTPVETQFMSAFEQAFRDALLRRLGLCSADPDTDGALCDAVFGFLRDSEVGFEQFFFDWRGGALSDERARRSPARDHYAGSSFLALRRLMDRFAPQCPSALASPYYELERPVTLLVDEIEAIWARIDRHDDWSRFDDKVHAIREAGAQCVAPSSPAQGMSPA